MRFRFQSKNLFTKNFANREAGQSRAHRRGKNLQVIPFDVQEKLGQANVLYAQYSKHEEALSILKEVREKHPELAEPVITMASIYEELGDIRQCFRYSKMAAKIQKANVDRWLSCATLAKELRLWDHAIYCLNRAFKQSSKRDVEFFMSIKYAKLEIYKIKNDNASAVRMLLKLLKRFSKDEARHLELTVTLAETYSDQGLHTKSLELLDSLILRHQHLHPSNPGTTVLELLLVLSTICLKSKDLATFKVYL